MGFLTVGWGPTPLLRIGVVLAACALAFVAPREAGAGGITVTGDDVTAASGGAVAFTVSGHSEPVVGAFGIDVFFDEGLVAPQSCQVTNALCNTEAEPGHLRLNSVTLAGFSGDITFATIIFEAVGPAGSLAMIDVDVSAIADTEGYDLLGQVGVTDGSIAIDNSQPTPPGDANCDAAVNAGDSLAIISSLAGTAGAACFALADVNCDGKVDEDDALTILRAIGGLPADLPPGCDAIA